MEGTNRRRRLGANAWREILARLTASGDSVSARPLLLKPVGTAVNPFNFGHASGSGWFDKLRKQVAEAF